MENGIPWCKMNVLRCERGERRENFTDLAFVSVVEDDKSHPSEASARLYPFLCLAYCGNLSSYCAPPDIRAGPKVDGALLGTLNGRSVLCL